MYQQLFGPTLILLTSALLSCGGGGGRCIEGTTQACACAAGASGVQACTASGTFGPCDCGGGLDAGRPDGATEDGGADSGTMVGTGETVTAMVGLEGGTVELENATLTVPAGALATPTMITVTETTMPTPAGYRAFSPLYRFEPEGLVFEAPVTVSIRSNASGADVPLGTLFWSRDAADGGGWERLGGIPGGGEVEGQVTHFSFGFIADGVDYTAAPDTSCVRTRVLDTRTLPPSGVGLFFAMDDCWGRPITDLTDGGGDPTRANVRVYEDDMVLSSEASARLFDQRGLQVFITLAIDVSASTRPVLSEVIAAARSFVETLNEPARGLRDRVQVAVVGFAGEASPGFQQSHTLDLDLVLRRLDELATYEPSDASSTNLHGAVQYALSLSSGAQRNFRDRNRGGAFTAGYVALFTDGGDTAGRVPFETARMTLEQSPDDVIALGLRGDDYDPDALRTLVGDFAVYDAESTVVLDRDFRHIAARIAGQVRRSYLLGYCSPKRSGTHTVYASHRDAVERRVWGAPPEFNAASFTGGCNPVMFDPTAVCRGADCGGFGCGACDDRVATCDAAASSTSPGVCVSNCIARNFCSGEMFTNPHGYEQRCPMTAEQTLCGGTCVDTTIDPRNCGACGNECFQGPCSDGRCVNPAVQLALGGHHSCALLADHTVVCWGENNYGQLGDGTTTVHRRPAPVPGLTDVSEIAAGESSTCARVDDGSVLCWGGNQQGQLGDGTTDTRLLPTPVMGLTNAVQLSMGSLHTCARLVDSSVVCWGYNASGQLGDGTTTRRTLPTRMVGVDDAVEVQVGYSHSCLRRRGGGVLCTGFGGQGQRGDGTTNNSLVPTPVSSLTDAVQIAAGHDHACARLSGGGLSCWGYNGNGRLGDGSLVDRLVPTLIPDLGVEDVAAEGGHSCVRTVRSALCWGSNQMGQLGDGTTVDRHVPTAVTGIDSALEIVPGHFHTCARLGGGSVVCWGLNTSGQLGDGTTTNRSLPTLVARDAL